MSFCFSALSEARSKHFRSPNEKKLKLSEKQKSVGAQSPAQPFPTKTENFGIVVLEALSYGIPVITTNAAPWETLNEKSIGWCIEINEISLKKAIKDATSLEISELEKMGNESRKYASKYFNWDNVANEYVKAYKALNQI